MQSYTHTQTYTGGNAWMPPRLDVELPMEARALNAPIESCLPGYAGYRAWGLAFSEKSSGFRV